MVIVMNKNTISYTIYHGKRYLLRYLGLQPILSSKKAPLARGGGNNSEFKAETLWFVSEKLSHTI